MAREGDRNSKVQQSRDGQYHRRRWLSLVSLWGCLLLTASLPFIVAADAPPQNADNFRSHQPGDEGALHDFKVVRPRFVVRGANLSRVEIWFWPAGTGITEPALLGAARRITEAGKHETWVLRIPADLLAVEVFATAIDNAGNIVGKISLPYTGASALYDALYGNTKK